MEWRGIANATAFRRLIGRVWIAVATLGPASAFASGDIGSVAERVQGQVGQLADLLGAAAFLAGVAFVVFGIVRFYNHSKNPQDQQNKLSGAVMLIVAGAMMIAVPTVAGVGIVSLFGGSAETTNVGGTLRSIGGGGGFEN